MESSLIASENNKQTNERTGRKFASWPRLYINDDDADADADAKTKAIN